MNNISEEVYLFNFPLNIMAVDDDTDYLELLHHNLADMTLTTCNSTTEAMKILDPININTKNFLETNFSGIHDLNYKNIEDFVKNFGSKHGILISDYNMPNINGIEFLSKYSNTDLIKILLTNVYTNNEAVYALNKKLIHYYLPKEDVSSLENVIKEHQKLLFKNITKNILSFLDMDNLSFLSDKAYSYILNTICQKHNIIKYYILNSNGSYYLENKEEKFIFSIYSPTDLIEIAKEVSKKENNNVRQGNLIPSYFYNETTTCKLIAAEKYGNYSYCIEKLA
ncbi:MAG: hypothetical protein QG673_1682 [Pseudomonadota bacterium]|nr:hypothetical protein [Pseudomonadota bacterium]